MFEPANEHSVEIARTVMIGVVLCTYLLAAASVGCLVVIGVTIWILT